MQKVVKSFFKKLIKPPIQRSRGLTKIKQIGALEFVVKPAYSYCVHTKIIKVRQCLKKLVSNS